MYIHVLPCLAFIFHVHLQDKRFPDVPHTTILKSLHPLLAAVEMDVMGYWDYQDVTDCQALQGEMDRKENEGYLELPAGMESQELRGATG